MTSTYKVIASVTVESGGASNITFSSIPQTYTDICVLMTARSTNNASGANRWRDIGTNINSNGLNVNVSVNNLYGLGGNTYGSNQGVSTSGGVLVDLGSTTSTFASIFLYYPNYTSSTIKSFFGDAVTENNGTTALTLIWQGLYNSTSAISSLSYVPDTGNFAEHSTATLYGIKKD
jgi:hypothetical protein